MRRDRIAIIMLAGAVACACMMIAPSPAHAEKPLTFEQAQEIALKKVPGTVVDTERSIHDGAVVYEFDIRQENGAVMDIEIDSRTREILRLKIDRAGTGGSLPEPAVSAEDAQKTAIAYIKKKTSGLRDVEMLKSEYKIEDRTLVHAFTLRRGISEYRVVVDASSGEILSSETVH